ncbi:MAG: hypothetical protein ACI9IA_001438 [Enterobacterales bacterium]|jgi:hypothetical protein
MKKKLTPLIEYFSEATTACLITMVQGNLLSLTVGHLIIASQTGIFAGLLSSIVVIFAKIERIEIIAILLGLFTTIVDFYMHPGMFGSFATEAIVTGLGAGLLSYFIGLLISHFAKK